MMGIVLDFAEARERRARMVRLLADALMLRIAGVDIADHLVVLAAMPLFAAFTEEVA